MTQRAVPLISGVDAERRRVGQPIDQLWRGASDDGDGVAVDACGRSRRGDEFFNR